MIGHELVKRGKFRLALWALQNLRPLPSPQTANLINGMHMEIDSNEFVQSQIYSIGAYGLRGAQYSAIRDQDGHLPLTARDAMTDYDNLICFPS